ncbi:HU family DNA-binding protein [Tropicibacter sp. R15_0]|nr:HU family DNA-binding protein [Tropicibacter sp. R15_0]
MKKKELIDLAVERSGIKKRDAKPAIEAALAVLGEALAEGREINMRPMGKIKVSRMKKVVNGQVINARIRQPEAAEPSDDPDGTIDTDPLAQAAE